MPHPRLGTLTKSLDVVTAASVLLVLASAGRVAWLAGAYATAIAATVALRAVAIARLRQTGVDGLPAPGPAVAAVETPRSDRPDDRRLGHGHRHGVHAGTGRRRLARGGRADARAHAPALPAVAARGGRRPRRGGRVRAARLVCDCRRRRQAQPGNILVAVRHPHALEHVAAALQGGADREVVVMTVRLHGVDTDSAGPDDPTPLPAERYLFSRVITLVERYGRPVRLLVVPAATVRRRPGDGGGPPAVVRGLRRRVRDALVGRPGAAARRGLGAYPETGAAGRPARRPSPQRARRHLLPRGAPAGAHARRPRPHSPRVAGSHAA